MRRFISLACVAFVIITLIVSPVSASNYDSVGYIDLLEPGRIIVNDNYSYDFRVTLNGQPGYISFPTTSTAPLGEFELLIYTNDSNLSLSSGYASCTVNPSVIGSDYYVVKGNFGGYGPYLTYNSSLSDGFLFVISGKSVGLNYSIPEIMYDFQVFDASNGSKLSDQTGQYRTEFSDEFYYDAIDRPYVRQIRIYPNKEQLAGLDYFDLDLYLQNLEVGSISASFGGNALDIDCTYSFIGDGTFNNALDPGEYDENKTFGCYKVDLRVDVSGINLLEGAPTVFITYTSNNYGSTVPYVYVYGINGGLFLDNIDPSLQIQYSIFDKLAQLYDSVVSGFSDLSSVFVTYISNIEVWLRNESNYNQNYFTVKFSELTNHLTAVTVDLIANINFNFERLQTWMNDEFTNLKNHLTAVTVDLIANINFNFERLHGWLTSFTDRIENAIRGDTAPGKNFQQQVDQKDQQLNDMAAVMDSVSKPEIDSVNVSADTYVDQTVLASSMSGLTAVISMPVFLDVIMMALIMATAGYVLFGKR